MLLPYADIIDGEGVALDDSRTPEATPAVVEVSVSAGIDALDPAELAIGALIEMARDDPDLAARIRRRLASLLD